MWGNMNNWTLCSKKNPKKSGFYWVTRIINNGKRVAQNACFDGDWNVPNVIAWIKYPEPMET